MRVRYFWQISTLLLVVAALLTVAFYAYADCLPSTTGTPNNDTIQCTITNQPAATDAVEGLDGDDNIIIDEGVYSNNAVSGDSAYGTDGTGDDVIINNGTVGDWLLGDSDYGDGSGDDIIVNNGTSDDIIGDTGSGTGSGNDAIVNNGTADAIHGDSFYDGSGNDNVVNNGYVANNITGDAVSGTGTGSDSISNNGLVGGSIYGDSQMGSGSGNDTITNSGVVAGDIVAGGGNDTVVIQGGSYVGGVIDGGADYDVLTFNLTTTDPEELQEMAAQIAAANPAGGTITLQGVTYTWQNFEELSQILLSLVRLNELGDPFAVYCSLGGGVDIYAIVNNQGILSLNISAQALSNAISFATTNGVLVTVDSSATSTVYVLPSGEVQINAPNGADYSFNYESLCGVLPPAGEIIEEVEVDSFVIVNRPR